VVQAREHIIRGTFSSIAAASLLYMSAEFAEAAMKDRRPEAALLSVVCVALTIPEAGKVGRRVECILRVGE